MINSDDFIKRLEKLLDYLGISASAFADTIGVQRSGLSHLLSGRNKPSLDFVLKIVETYPEIDLYWLLNGKGSLPGDAPAPVSPKPVDTIQPPKEPVKPATSPPPVETDLFTFSQDYAVSPPIAKPTVPDYTPAIIQGDIDRIVVFYKDGTFKNYNPEK